MAKTKSPPRTHTTLTGPQVNQAERTLTALKKKLDQQTRVLRAVAEHLASTAGELAALEGLFGLTPAATPPQDNGSGALPAPPPEVQEGEPD